VSGDACFTLPEVDGALLLKYDQSGPRYTSYPTAPHFHPGFGQAEFREEIRRSQEETPGRGLSLYFHLPFCESVCFFCGCNVTFTADRSRPEPYIGILAREMDNLLPAVARGRKVEQLHWGGGTPTFFKPDQMRRVWDAIAARFDFAQDAEIGVESDPRETTPEHLRVLAECGFNRLSLGVQDFDPAVQKAVNRIQPESVTRDTVQAARDHGFTSVSVDLIYGLPLQTLDSFRRTLERVVALAPDRVALFNLAYLPEMIRHQKALRAEDLPGPKVKIEILRAAIAAFHQAGYRYIGMDHFAKPGDELCAAQDAGGLYRNFQGYTTHAGCDLLAFGVSGISQAGRCYAQNEKNIHGYIRRVEAGDSPVMRGVQLSDDDLVRRDIIMRIMCDFRLDFAAVERAVGRPFAEAFAPELAALEPMVADGLVRVGEGSLAVLPPGRLLVRSICMVFDRYLREKPGHTFSRTV